MSKAFKPTPHPVLVVPTIEQAMAMGVEGFTRKVVIEREQIIQREKDEPMEYSWEPPIWKVCDAILGFDWVDPVWAAKVRAKLGFRKPVKVLLIMGANRGSKTQYAANRSMRVLRSSPGRRGWALHQTMPRSREYHQPLFYKYLPAALRLKDIKERTTYIAYKQKTGFSEEKFVLPNESEQTFLAYEQQRTVIEGGELDIIWDDELVPADWVETQEYRIATRGGNILVTFTPILGYTDTVAMFQTGATIVRESIAFLCPSDGGAPDEARALGLTPEEYAEIQKAAEEKRAACAPQSRPEDCNAWLEDKSGQPAVPEGRSFEMVPRVARCVSEKEDQRAIVWFHSCDNPYGNPKEILATVRGEPMDNVKMRVYGIAKKSWAARFGRFDRNAHVVPAAQIPKEGLNYLYIDPASSRNFFMTWFRVTPEQIFIYREWPSAYHIPDVGIPGPWALPDGKKKDGRPGPGAESFDFSLVKYKREIARLEGWTVAQGPKPANMSENDWIASWADDGKAVERIEVRKLDSRFASTPKVERDRPVTLLTELDELGLIFEATPGDDIDEGVQLIKDALDYDAAAPIGFLNKPRLVVSEECGNTIYALQTWTGKDGRHGATKDPIDNIRYFLLDNNGEFLSKEDYETEGGGHY